MKKKKQVSFRKNVVIISVMQGYVLSCNDGCLFYFGVRKEALKVREKKKGEIERRWFVTHDSHIQCGVWRENGMIEFPVLFMGYEDRESALAQAYLEMKIYNKDVEKWAIEKILEI